MPKRTPEYMAAQRDRILEAALKCFADKGFHQTSTDDIARAARCGKSAIYAHFASKRAMIEAFTEREMEHYGTHAVRDLGQFEKYVADSFDNLQTPRMRQYSRITLQLAAESLTDPDYLDWQDRLTKRSFAWLEPLIRNDPSAAGLTDGQVRDATRRLMYFWAGQALYKMVSPDLSASLLRADMATVAPAIIESARRAPTHQTTRRAATTKRSVAARRRPAAVRQTMGTKRTPGLHKTRR
jgi:AcrR family transcriptional regulator